MCATVWVVNVCVCVVQSSSVPHSQREKHCNHSISKAGRRETEMVDIQGGGGGRHREQVCLQGRKETKEGRKEETQLT